jgi:hypothetical protein
VNPSLATADYPTHPPLPETLTNEFTGWSLKQIWEWFEENEEVLKEKGFAEGNCVVVDEEGLKGEEETVLYFERVYEDEEEEEEKERAEGGEKYKVMRCPVCRSSVLDFFDPSMPYHVECFLPVFPTLKLFLIPISI